MSFSTEPIEAGEVIAPEIMQLLDMLRYCRPHDSTTEREWVCKFVLPTGATPLLTPAGAVSGYVVDIMDGDKDPTVMFSSHVDTVHFEPGMQVVQYDKDMQVAYKSDNKPLGADDAAGVWLMLQMIEAEVPGRYVFHRGEEKGGIGSRAIVRDHAWVSKDMTAAVAFDRKSECSIITHQRHGRCCSDEFAAELGARITNRMPTTSDGTPLYVLTPDDGGVYTDTAEYTDDIGECTNVSIGYIDEHSGKEMLNVEYLLHLRDACCDPDMWIDLPNKRMAGEQEPRDDFWGGYYGGMWGKYGQDTYSLPKPKAKLKSVPRFDLPTPAVLDAYDISDMKRSELVAWIETAAVEELVDTLFGLADAAMEADEQIERLTDQLAETQDIGSMWDTTNYPGLDFK